MQITPNIKARKFNELSSDYDARITAAAGVGAGRGGVTHGRGVSQRTRGWEHLMLRLRVGVQQRRLDHELAEGLPVSGSRERELRAAQLVDRRSRAVLAGSLRRLLTVAKSGRQGLSPMIAPASGAVLQCQAAMLALAKRIDSDTPVTAAGVARTRLLLADGAGPLYSRAAHQSLTAELLAIEDALDA